jgi:pyruvate dehydrogenase E1 component
VNNEKKEIYSSRSQSASPSGNGNGDKVGESLQSVFELALQSQGPERTAQLLEKLANQLRSVPRPAAGLTTPYVNTIPVADEPKYPGDWRVENRIKSLMR